MCSKPYGDSFRMDDNPTRTVGRSAIRSCENSFHPSREQRMNPLRAVVKDSRQIPGNLKPVDHPANYSERKRILDVVHD